MHIYKYNSAHSEGNTMELLVFLSNFMIPMIIFYVLATAVVRKVNIYETFLEGVKEGFGIVLKLVPTLVALLVSVGVLRASGIFEVIFQGLRLGLKNGITNDQMLHIGGCLLPLAVIPVFIIRLFSSSAASGLLLDIFKQYGADSLAGNMAAISLSCTEAVLYCLSIYFVSVGIQHTKWTLKGSLLASASGIVAAIIISNIWMR